jgi:YesN/AraC family two-component response regulator
MTKYNITPKEKKAGPSYRSIVQPEIVEETAAKIISRLMVDKKYRDSKYSAKQLAKDIGVNMRQISAVINARFQQNYSELVGTMRIFEAKYMLGDANFANMKMEDIAINVGFTTRQSFYATFYKLCGITPKEYRKTYGTIPEPKPAKPKKKNKAAIHNKKTK